MTKKSILQRGDWPGFIKGYRLHLKMTVLQFARRFEVSPQAVYMWEHGQTEAPYRVTEQVLDWLLEGRENA